MTRPLCLRWVEPPTPDGAEFLKILLSVDFVGHWIMLVDDVADGHREELTVRVPPLRKSKELSPRWVNISTADAGQNYASVRRSKIISGVGHRSKKDQS